MIIPLDNWKSMPLDAANRTLLFIFLYVPIKFIMPEKHPIGCRQAPYLPAHHSTPYAPLIPFWSCLIHSPSWFLLCYTIGHCYVMYAIHAIHAFLFLSLT